MGEIFELIADLFITGSVTKNGKWFIAGFIAIGLCIGGYFLFK